MFLSWVSLFFKIFLLIAYWKSTIHYSKLNVGIHEYFNKFIEVKKSSPDNNIYNSMLNQNINAQLIQ